MRWLHEVDRLFPYGRPAPDLRSPAPPMEYALFRQQPDGNGNGAVGGNGGGNGGGSADLARTELLGHRAKALRHHPLSMEVDRNRALAWRVILGDDENESVQRDIITVADRDRARPGSATSAQTMGAGWLEGVLSWPRRFVLPFEQGGAPEITFAESS